MKIISLNTWSGVLMEPLLDFFVNYKEVDVFCLQEMYSNARGKATQHPELDFQLDLLEQIMKVLGETHVAYFRPAHKDYYGQAMIIKKHLHVEEEGEIMIYHNPNPMARGTHSRNMQYARITDGDRTVFVGNVHGLWNGQGKTDTPDRLEQSRIMHAFIEGRSEEQKVIVGDFNLDIHTESLAIVEKGLNNLIKAYGITSTRTSHYTKEVKYADYALVSAAVEVKAFRVLPEEVSDHAALYLEI